MSREMQRLGSRRERLDAPYNKWSKAGLPADAIGWDEYRGPSTVSLRSTLGMTITLASRLSFKLEP